MPSHIRRETRALFTVGLGLAITAGLSLFVLTEQTDRFFAWTIASPLTAAFLGALYLGDIPRLVLARRATAWPEVRQTAWGVFFFTAFSLVATLKHLDKFHLTGDLGTATVAGWLWMAVYVTLPIAAVAVIYREERAYGRSGAGEVTSGARLVHAGMFVLAGGLGLALLVWPGLNLWPWSLTPLTSRAISARILAFAGLAWLSVRGRDVGQAGAGAASLFTRAALVLLAVARYPSEIDLTSPSGRVFLGLCGVALVMGAIAMRAGAVRASLNRESQ